MYSPGAATQLAATDLMHGAAARCLGCRPVVKPSLLILLLMLFVCSLFYFRIVSSYFSFRCITVPCLDSILVYFDYLLYFVSTYCKRRAVAV